MKISDLSWEDVEIYLARDDRCVLPIGSTEQHGRLSLSVDSILAEKVAIDAAGPLGVPVFPRLDYGLCPYFAAYPGSVTLRVETLLAVVRDILDAFRAQGFRRVLIVNGHGGNAPVGALALDFMREHPEMTIRFHNWWMAPKTWAKVLEIDPVASHASWMENFPWTRIPNRPLPEGRKEMIDIERMRLLPPAKVREYLGDGVFGGLYTRPDEDMLALWEVAVEETRALIAGPWA